MLIMYQPRHIKVGSEVDDNKAAGDPWQNKYQKNMIKVGRELNVVD